jgi:hypothetical protein
MIGDVCIRGLYPQRVLLDYDNPYIQCIPCILMDISHATPR